MTTSASGSSRSKTEVGPSLSEVTTNGCPRPSRNLRSPSSPESGDVLYQGIAARNFERSFQLADHVQVKGASLENGLLHIDLVREIPEAMKPRAIPIASSDLQREGWNGGRYGVYYDLNTWRRYVSAAGFVELSHYYRPAGLGRERQPWLASVWRR